MLPRLSNSFQQGGMKGKALLGPCGSTPDLPVQGLQLYVGLQVHLYEEDVEVDGTHSYLRVDATVAGWNEKYHCWFATYDWDALKWMTELDGIAGDILFDEWVRRVFSREVIDHSWWWKEETNWNDLPPPLAVEYLSRLFEESIEILRGYTDAQVDQGLWLLFGPSSDHARCLLDLSISWPTRLRCVRSILRLFNMFAARCSPLLSHLDEPGASPLNSICYMFWDILPFCGRPEEPAFADLDHSLLHVMIQTLRLPSDACRESALHGLGHWQSAYPSVVVEGVDKFLGENPKIRPELRRYAEDARCGRVL